MKVIIDDNLPDKLLTDPYRINQVLVNLVSNAIKFTNNGDITLTLNTSPVDVVSIDISNTCPDVAPERVISIKLTAPVASSLPS